MFQRDPYALARPAFPLPILTPPTDPLASPTVAINVNCQWGPYIIGALQSLIMEATWNARNDAELQQALQLSAKLIDVFAQAFQPCTVQVFTCTYDFTTSSYNLIWNILPVVGVADTGSYVPGTGYQAGITGFLHPLFELDVQAILPDVQVDSLQVTYDAGMFGPTAFYMKFLDPMDNVLSIQTFGGSGIQTVNMSGGPFSKVRKIILHTDGDYQATITNVVLGAHSVSDPCGFFPLACYWDFSHSAYSAVWDFYVTGSGTWGTYTGSDYEGTYNSSSNTYNLYLIANFPDGIDASRITVTVDMSNAEVTTVRVKDGTNFTGTLLASADSSGGHEVLTINGPLTGVKSILIAFNAQNPNSKILAASIEGMAPTSPCA